ncbi:MAG TPA: hypothetical protein DD400_03375 [Rhodospirillaceae bacterium]|nr:hypothetical protein [Rhodospirillaceae bacterium]
METAFTLVMGLLFGLVLGSFVTMLSYRIPRKLSIVKPPSQCPSCKHRLMRRDLIPIFSWLTQRGICRYCNARIGRRYLVIEILVTLTVTLTFLIIGLSFALLPALLAIVALASFVVIWVEDER